MAIDEFLASPTTDKLVNRPMESLGTVEIAESQRKLTTMKLQCSIRNINPKFQQFVYLLAESSNALERDSKIIKE